MTELNCTLISSVCLCWLLLCRPKNPTWCQRRGGLQPEKGVMQKRKAERRLEDFVEPTQSCLPWLSATRCWVMNNGQLSCTFFLFIVFLIRLQEAAQSTSSIFLWQIFFLRLLTFLLSFTATWKRKFQGRPTNWTLTPCACVNCVLHVPATTMQN